MILLLDAGNTLIKWWIRSAGGTVARGSVATVELGEPPPAWMRLGPARALASCVADAVTRNRLDEMFSRLGMAVDWLSAAAAAHGLVNRYQPPERLGPDRYAALVAAHRLDLGDCVVVGVGTALTADMLTRSGEFLGGCIVPGPVLMRRALAQGTAGVAAGPAPGEAFPRDTESAVATGIGLAMAGVVNGMREQLARSAGARPMIVLSGGARQELRPWLDVDVVEVDDLVLEGLAWIARDLACAN